MLQSDEEWLSIADAFGTAALDGSWHEALASLASACGSRTGQLIGFGPGTVDFNYWTAVSPEVIDEFAAVGGADPAVNPRVRAGRAVPELSVLTERDFISPDEFATNELYSWGRSRDLVFSCLSPLIHSAERMVGLALIRSEAEGHFESPERDRFASLAPHVRAAARTHLLLEGQAIALLTGTLEALSMAAFVCDARGRVVGHTALAEAELAAGYLRLQHGSLTAAGDLNSGGLQSAIAEAVAGLQRPGLPVHRTVLLRADAGADPLVLDVISLPRRAADFSARARALVVVRRRRDSSGVVAAVRRIWGLTRAEADVAIRLAEGRSKAEIADARGVSVGTVRMQAKSIYAKVGVKRQAELGGRLQPLL